jgi:hypothetical protein
VGAAQCSTLVGLVTMRTARTLAGSSLLPHAVPCDPNVAHLAGKRYPRMHHALAARYIFAMSNSCSATPKRQLQPGLHCMPDAV